MKVRIEEMYEIGGHLPAIVKKLDELNKRVSRVLNRTQKEVSDDLVATMKAVLKNSESLCMDSEEDREQLLNNLVEAVGGISQCDYTTSHTKKDFQS